MPQINTLLSSRQELSKAKYANEFSRVKVGHVQANLAAALEALSVNSAQDAVAFGTPAVMEVVSANAAQTAILGAKSSAAESITAAATHDAVASGSVETTFDSQYVGWTPITGTAYLSQQALTDPNTKATTVASPSWTDARFGTKIFQATALADSGDSPVSQRHEYSRRQAFNCDNTRYLAQATNGHWFLYNASTFARINGGRTTSPGLNAIGIGSTSSYPAGDCEPIWHPTDPNKLWYTDTNGGMAVYEHDLVAGTRTTYINWTTVLSGLGAPWSTTVARVWWQGEGRPSDDGDIWAMAAQTSGFGSVGAFVYKKSTNTVLGSIQYTTLANWVSTSRSGAYCLIGWDTFAGLTMAQCAAAGINATDGTRAYTTTFGSFQQLNYFTEHGDCAIDALGNDVWVSVNYDGVKMPDVTDGNCYYRRLDNGVATQLPLNSYIGLSAAWHFSGFLNGFALIGSYFGPPGSAWKDEVLMLTELKTSAQKSMRIAHHRSSLPGTGGGYFSEPHATINRQGTRVMFCSNFGNAYDTKNLSYMIGLPSDWKTRI
jgi:hypothetical protein